MTRTKPTSGCTLASWTYRPDSFSSVPAAPGNIEIRGAGVGGGAGVTGLDQGALSVAMPEGLSPRGEDLRITDV